VSPGRQVLGLGAHILDLGQLQRAVLLGLGESRARDIGMDVDLKCLVILADDQTVADAVEVGAEGLQVHIGGGLAHDEHRVKGEGDVLGRDGPEISLLRLGGLLIRGHLLAPHLVQHPLEDQQEARAAGIHHAGLFQHRVLVDRVGQGQLSLLDGGLQHCLEAVVLPGGAGSPGRGQAGHGEDGALGGLHHRLIGGGYAEIQGDGQIPAVHGLPLLDGLGKAPEQQGQDDAGVAPGPPQQRGGGGLGGLAHGVEGLLLHLRGGSPDGQAHIGARVAVRDGEHVQIVDALFFRANGGGGVDDHLLKGRRINGLSHIGPNSFLQMSLKPHGVHTDVHRFHFHPGGLADHIADLAHNGAADRHQVDSVLHDDVQLDGDGPVLVVIYLDALRHGLPLEEMDQAVGLGADRHALYAVAVGGRTAGHGGEHLAADADLAQIVLQFHKSLPSFR